MKNLIGPRLWAMFISFFLGLSSAYATDERGIFNPDCFTNENCSVVILKIPEGYYAADVTSADIRQIHQLEIDARNAWLKTTLPYQSIDFFFGITTMNESIQQLTEVTEAEAMLMQSGAGSSTVGTGGQIVVAYGADIEALLARNKREAYAKLGLTVLGWIPASKLIGSAYKGVRLGAGAQRMEHMAQDGAMSVAEREVLGRYLWKLGEINSALAVYRATTVGGVRAAFRASALSNLKIVGKWAAWTTALRISGLSIPQRPSSLAPADLAKFAYTQGAMIISGNLGNPTTRAIKLAGHDAWNYINRFVTQFTADHADTSVSTIEALSQVAATCDGCDKHKLPANIVNRLSEAEIIRHLEVLVDDEGTALVRFNPRPGQ